MILPCRIAVPPYLVCRLAFSVLYNDARRNTNTGRRVVNALKEGGL
jgi:hypothetical protein